jgi:inner membrane protein
LPSIFSHAIVGLSGGRIIPLEEKSRKFWFFSILCPILPDADTFGLVIGVPYNHFFGHRGFFHSIPFAFILALLVVVLFFRKKKILSKKWSLLLLYFFIITSTHGILDAFTSGGLGIALLSPFDNTRYFFPFTPIAVSPLKPGAFFSGRGLQVILSEIIWVWLPAILIMLAVNYIQVRHRRQFREIET